jgi:hypothetical protein
MYAQLSEGGLPKSFSSAIVDEGQVLAIDFSKPNAEDLILEDIQRDANGLNLRDAIAVPVNRGLEDAGIWFNQPDGSRIWRYKIRVSEALSLEPYFDQFFLPVGSEFFIFNHDGTEIYGAYTDQNNSMHGRFSADMVQGEVINFEYYEPAEVIGEGVIHLLDVGYRYRDVIGLDENSGGGGAQACQVDVSCTEGQAWQNQVRSTVRIRTRINGQFFWCSGTLMNNTALDCRPLILTSLRCATDGNEMAGMNDFDTFRFYFNYQSEACDAGAVFSGASMSGCSSLGDSNDEGGAFGSDYLIMELNNTIPPEFAPYYAGWNASGNVGGNFGVTVHHPSGDVKKISSFQEIPTTSDWGVQGTHWRVNWSSTENGHGVCESGSYGSGLFNASGLVIGTLTGGVSSCSEVSPNGQDLPDFFGKMSHHWSNNPNPEEEKLRTILDPIGNNLEIFSGSDAPCTTGLKDYQSIDFYLFPNPTSHILNLNISSIDAFEINRLFVSDVLGKTAQVEANLNQEQVTIDVSAFESGLYFLTIQLESGSLISRPFVVSF